MAILDGGTPTGLPVQPPAVSDTTGRILVLAGQQLQDMGAVTWTYPKLLNYLNLGIVEIIDLKPDAYTETDIFALVAGVTQDVPANAFQVIDIVCNIGADGVTPGAAIRPLSKQKMDSMLPGWMMFTPTSPMTTPAAPTGTPAITGGSVPDGTYYYVVTAVNQYGETVKGSQSAAQVISGGTGHGSVALTWPAVSGATSYRVYRTTTTGSYVSPCLVASPSTASCTDTTVSASAGAPPTADSSGSKIKFAMIDDRNPKVFYVWPPPATPGVQKIQAVVSASPVQLTAVDDAFPLDDSFIPAAIDYLIYRSLAEETTIPNALNKATMFQQKFMQDLGLKSNTEKQVEAAGQ